MLWKQESLYEDVVKDQEVDEKPPETDVLP